MAGLCGAAHSDGTVWQVGLSSTKDAVRAERLWRLFSFLQETSRDHPFEYLGAEESAFGSPNGRVKAMHNEYLGVLKLVGVMLEVPVFLYKPTQIKKFATGNGRASKPEMIAACRKKLGIPTDSDDVADAAWVLAMMKKELWT